MPTQKSKARRSLRLGAWALLCCILSCTMPLPNDLPCPDGGDTSNPNCRPSTPNNNPSNGANNGETPLPATALQKIRDVTLRAGRYENQNIEFLNLDTCPSNSPNCINRLNPTLTPLKRYEFFFNDNSPVFGQFPVFDAPSERSLEQPFRRVVRVIVPNEYDPNTIQSAADVIASRYRTEETGRVENNPLIDSAALPDFGVNFGRAWLQNNFVDYLELGSVPNSSNGLGTSFIYFLRNNDKTDLPSQPTPILDTVPGDLLYSPIRQVFRAVSEEQITRQENDPSRTIRSQEELLNAINNGLFRLEETQEYFNFPVYRSANRPIEEADIVNLRIQSAAQFPALPPGSHYTLWAINQVNEALLLLEFSAENQRLQSLSGTPITTGPAGEIIFRFRSNQLSNFRQFLVTIESGTFTQPTGATLLESSFDASSRTLLETPFASQYQELEPASFLLAAPTSLNRSEDISGLWFVERSDSDFAQLPARQNLSAGLQLPLAPRGWAYQLWVKTEFRTPIWLPGGAFQDPQAPDDNAQFSNPAREGYPFPGEDFLRNAPSRLFFPFNLTSTGEREVYVSLEPNTLQIREPFFSLYQQVLLRNVQARRNQSMPARPVDFPRLEIDLSSN